MTDQEFSYPVPSTEEVRSSMLPAVRKWERIALKWRALAEQRREHYVELYQTGRWRHYYTANEFLLELRKAVALAERWTRIVPTPEERRPLPAEIERLRAA